MAGRLLPEPPADHPGLFVTGTDTGVGKTFVTALIVRWLRSLGRPVAVCKPVATGARLIRGRLASDDSILLAAAAGLGEDWDQVTAWAFAEPAAPPVAARQAGVSFVLAEVVEAVRRRRRPGVPLLVEGVGGLLCPLTESATVADLAAQLGLPLVVVARRGLGTLNHTLLTLEAAAHRGLRVAGVVVSETEPVRGLAAETNVAELRRRTAVPVLAVVPHQTEPPPNNLTAIRAVDWWAVCHGEETRLAWQM